MSEFTLLTALNSIKKNLLVTIVIFVITYLLLPSSNILETRYTMQKTIIPAKYEPGYPFDHLNYSQISAISSNSNTSIFIDNNIENGQIAQFKVSRNPENNILINFKSNNTDNIIFTAKLIMERLQSFDELQIQKKINFIEKEINNHQKLIEMIISSKDKYTLSNADIEKFVSMQKIYDAAYDVGSVGESVIEIDKIVSLKIDETNLKLSKEQSIFELNNLIDQLTEVKTNGFQPVTYLFPVSIDDISKYYPNQMIFFSISLLVSLIYNLIMLNILYIKHKNNV